ncbi:TPA: glycosyltransferase family 2 protein [Pasteurella multocida]
MENKPLVSVLICAYNVEKYIEEYINAVINQTYKNLEIIIVNDGSSDNTYFLLKKLAEKDNRIKILNFNNHIGIISALNEGLKEIAGEYIARTDSDDITKPDWIEKILTCMQNDPKIIAMGSYLTVLSEENNGSVLANHHKNKVEWKNPLEHKDIVEKMLFGNPIHNNSMVMRSEIYTKYHLIYDPDYHYAEDYKFWLEVSRIGKLANYPESLVYYRLHRNQTSSIHNSQQEINGKKLRLQALNYYLKDLGIDYQLPEKFLFKDIALLQEIFYERGMFRENIIRRIIYECYLSLGEYNYKDIYYFLINKNNFLSIKDKFKIIKKYLRPDKYSSTY